MDDIREATEDDYEGICKLVSNKEELYLIHPNGEYPFTVSQVKEIFRVRNELTVVVNCGNVIGFANLYSYEPKKFAFIGNLIIGKAFRGRGIGKDIVTYLIKKATHKYSLPEVRISVFNENTTALLLYSKLGFKPYSMEEREGLFNNRISLIHLKLKLGVK